MEHGSNIDSALLRFFYRKGLSTLLSHPCLCKLNRLGFSILHGDGISLRGLTRLRRGVGTGRGAA